MKRTILVTGANGQLGHTFKALEHTYPHYQFLWCSKSDLDITAADQVDRFLDKQEVHFMINCAAYTAVDDAEKNEETAHQINVLGAQILAKACKSRNITLWHISTDYVFDGKNTIPYTEEDTTSPLSIYGKTKREGELAILSNCNKAFIIRTSWLYSTYNQNFVKSMLRLGATKNELNIVADQHGSPTYAKDLALAILEMMQQIEEIQHENIPYGIYHYSNEGTASWFDFATEIMILSGTDCKVNSIPTEAYPTPAPRPAYSVMNKEKITTHFKLVIPHWKKSLQRCLNEMEKD